MAASLELSLVRETLRLWSLPPVGSPHRILAPAAAPAAPAAPAPTSFQLFGNVRMAVAPWGAAAPRYCYTVRHLFTSRFFQHLHLQEPYQNSFCLKHLEGCLFS